MNTGIPAIPNGLGNTWSEYFAHANHSPADATENIFAWRISSIPETTNAFNNRLILPGFKTRIRGIRMSWRMANTPTLEVVPFYIRLFDRYGNVKQSFLALESPFNQISGGSSGSAFNENLDILCDASEQILISYIQTWVTNPLTLILTGALTLERA